jgi:hypothetical protein
MTLLQQRLNRLIAEDERNGVGSVADRSFFEQHPDRSYRMRLATPNEVAVAELNGSPPPTGGQFVWMAVRQVAPGVRMRLQVNAAPPVGPIADIPEDVVREIFGGLA